jgi:hypothetical protein
MGASADGINMMEAMRQPQQEKGQWAVFALGIAYEVMFSWWLAHPPRLSRLQIKRTNCSLFFGSSRRPSSTAPSASHLAKDG